MSMMDLPDNDPTAAALRRAVNGEFVLKRQIGRGGMGVVYLARDEQLQREVAIKTLPPHLAADAQVRSRFLREARTAAALSHPNIVPIYSAAERDGVVFFSMGFIDGESLAERVARLGPLSPDEVVALLGQLADALGFAHDRGVVHRDVKAENVLLDRRTGRAVVTDFGIARVAEAQPLTATGTVLGSVHYMSPEQVSGEPLDGRSDLYSLGVLAFFALTGRFPFERATASAVVVAHVNASAPRVSSVLGHCPPVLDALVARLLSKSPLDRYADAGALRAALQSPDFHRHRAVVVRDVGIPGTNHAEPVMLTSIEAAEVWSRAADLQANTGVILPPPSFTPRSDAPLVTQGYDAALVKASAVEAGIDEKYVARALQERQAAVRTMAEPGVVEKTTVLAAGSNKLEFSMSFDGELSADALEDVADEVRAALGEPVTISAVGRTLTVNTGMTTASAGAGTSRLVQVHVSSRHGRTHVRVFENLAQLAGALYAGVGIGAGLGVGALMAGLIGKFTHNPALAIAGFVGMPGLSFLGAHLLYVRAARKREVELKKLLQRVVERARG